VGPYGEPANKLDGIIQQGEGGDTVIYLFNSETGRLERNVYASESEGE
jgi:hypothetical protein